MLNNKLLKESRDVWTGSQNAPIALVVFNDYESQACAILNDVLKEIVEVYPKSIKINIRHFPLANKHQKAMKAAEAAVAAAQENLFWPMHNIMFENRKNLGITTLKSYAKKVGVTNKQFLNQLMNGVYAWQVREDLMEGVEKGVRDVPGVFINGIAYNGELSFSGISELIETLLRKIEDTSLK